MRIKRDVKGEAEGDLTPMIDMTFQLIAFFMVLINFSDAEQDQSIRLPSSELAKPPDKPFDEPRYIQLTKKGTVIFAGDEIPLERLSDLLIRERQVLVRGGGKPSDVTVVIRADGAAKVGEVQKIIEQCQNTKFEKFALRAKSEESG
jgi:biopolymer transport protein ExbD